MDLFRSEWLCPQCGETLKAFTLANLEIIKRLHLDAHHHLWVGKHPQDYMHLFNGRHQNSETGDWSDWSDVKFMVDCGIDPLAEDTRTDEELTKRYGPDIASDKPNE